MPFGVIVGCDSQHSPQGVLDHGHNGSFNQLVQMGGVAEDWGEVALERGPGHNTTDLLEYSGTEGQ
jgi:hypothetical protein